MFKVPRMVVVRSDDEEDCACTGEMKSNGYQKHVPKSYGIEAQVCHSVKRNWHIRTSGPEHPCSCHRTLSFEVSLQNVSLKVLSRLNEDLERVKRRDDEGFLINRFCGMCRSSLIKGEVPVFSSSNGVCFVDLPVTPKWEEYPTRVLLDYIVP